MEKGVNSEHSENWVIYVIFALFVLVPALALVVSNDTSMTGNSVSIFEGGFNQNGSLSKGTVIFWSLFVVMVVVAISYLFYFVNRKNRKIEI